MPDGNPQSSIKLLGSYLWHHAPYIIGALLIAVNALIDNGAISLSDHAANVINALLAASGLGILHKRQ